jgi:hypothetical protein
MPSCASVGLNNGIDLSCAKRIIYGAPTTGICRSGESMYGGLCYTACRSGYSNFGCCICRPPVPNCASHGLNQMVDLDCGKRIIFGDPVTGICPGANQVEEAGLCYKKCDSGYSGTGPVCWMRAPKGWVECGMGSAKDAKECGFVLVDQISSPFEVVAALVSFGSSNVVTKSTKAGLTAVKAAGRAADAVSAANKASKALDLAKIGGNANRIAKASELATTASKAADAAQTAMKNADNIADAAKKAMDAKKALDAAKKSQTTLQSLTSKIPFKKLDEASQAVLDAQKAVDASTKTYKAAKYADWASGVGTTVANINAKGKKISAFRMRCDKITDVGWGAAFTKYKGTANLATIDKANDAVRAAVAAKTGIARKTIDTLTGYGWKFVDTSQGILRTAIRKDFEEEGGFMKFMRAQTAPVTKPLTEWTSAQATLAMKAVVAAVKVNAMFPGPKTSANGSPTATNTVAETIVATGGNTVKESEERLGLAIQADATAEVQMIDVYVSKAADTVANAQSIAAKEGLTAAGPIAAAAATASASAAAPTPAPTSADEYTDEMSATDIARNAAMVASLVDPSGISSVVAAYTYDTCTEAFGPTVGH